MTEEELNYCMKEFSKGYGFIFKNGLKISFYQLCSEIKELRYKNRKSQQRIDKVIDVLNQPMLNYAGCIKALDEIEEILTGAK